MGGALVDSVLGGRGLGGRGPRWDREWCEGPGGL